MTKISEVNIRIYRRYRDNIETELKKNTLTNPIPKSLNKLLKLLKKTEQNKNENNIVP